MDLQVAKRNCQMRHNDTLFGFVAMYRAHYYAGERMWSRAAKFAKVYPRGERDRAERVAKQFHADVLTWCAGAVL